MRGKQTIIKVTHEFVEDPSAVQRGYETWALLLARSMNLSTVDEAPLVKTRTPRRGTKEGTA